MPGLMNAGLHEGREKLGSHLLLSSSVETSGMEHAAKGRGGRCHQAWAAFLALLLLLAT